MPENPKPPQAESLHSEVIRSDEKILYVDLKRNHRGVFFRITEVTEGKRTSIVVPLQLSPDLAAALMNLSSRALAFLPPTTQPPKPPC